MQREHLFVDTRRGLVLHNGAVVRSITRHWAYVYGLLVLHRLEHQQAGIPETGVTADQINRLPTWTQVQARSLATTLFRHLEGAKALGLMAAPPHERTKRFWLRTDLEVGADVEVGELRAWLGMTEPQAATRLTDNSIMAAYWFALAQIAYDQGRDAEVESHVREGLNMQPTIDQKMQGMAVWAQAMINGGTPVQARTVLDQMHQLAKQARHQAADNPGPLSPACEALIWIHEVRLAWRLWQPRKLRQYVNKAASLLTDQNHREWAGLEAALGYLAQRSGNLEEAEKRYKAALIRSSLAHMAKGIHFQQINLSAIYFIQYQNNRDINPSLAHVYLEQGLNLTLAAKRMSDTLDLSGNGDIEVNLAFAYREKGSYSEAQRFVDRAFNVAKACNNNYVRALAHAELAELRLSQENFEEARDQWLQALTILREIGVSGDWINQIQQRLRELSGEVPLTHALKLW